jgi:hypothetical protein
VPLDRHTWKPKPVLKASPAGNRRPYGGWNNHLSGAPNNDRIVFAPGSGEDTINEFNRGNAVSSGAQAAECDLIRVWVYLGIQLQTY